MNLLSIKGAPRSGKTRTLIKLAQSAEPSDLVVYVSFWSRNSRSLLREAGLPITAKIVSVTAAREGFKGLRPSIVLIDDFHALAASEQHALLHVCGCIGVRHVVTAAL